MHTYEFMCAFVCFCVRVCVCCVYVCLSAYINVQELLISDIHRVTGSHLAWMIQLILLSKADPTVSGSPLREGEGQIHPLQYPFERAGRAMGHGGRRGHAR